MQIREIYLYCRNAAKYWLQKNAFDVYMINGADVAQFFFNADATHILWKTKPRAGKIFRA